MRNEKAYKTKYMRVNLLPINIIDEKRDVTYYVIIVKHMISLTAANKMLTCMNFLIK